MSAYDLGGESGSWGDYLKLADVSVALSEMLQGDCHICTGCHSRTYVRRKCAAKIAAKIHQDLP